MLIKEVLMKKLLFAAILLTSFPAAATSQAQEVLGRVFWRGMVDDRLHLSIKADKLETRTVSGKKMPDGIFSFTAPMPGRVVVVEVIKKKGRSKNVRVIEQPSESNKFVAIVEINDEGGGAKEYQLEIFWR